MLRERGVVVGRRNEGQDFCLTLWLVTDVLIRTSVLIINLTYM